VAAPAHKDDQSIAEVVADLKDLTVAYAKQETIEPLKGIGRYVGFGVAGSVLLSIGVTTFAVAVLRYLQTQTGSTFTGNLSWIPYLITMAFLAVVVGLAVWAISRDERARRNREATP
jgi:hypothetical protein